MSEALPKLKSRLEDIHSLNKINALLDWDLQTQMPPGGANARAQQIGVVSKLSHELFTATETGQLLDAAAGETQGASYDSNDASLLRVARRDYDKASKLPTELVTEMSRVTTLAHSVWAKARADNDFKSFAPTLEQILALKIRAAEYLGYTDHIYDAMLDDYEPGLKTSDVATMFEDLRKDLVPLVKAINERVSAVDDTVLHQDFDEVTQRTFAEMVITQFGYDFNRGRQDKAVHPFETSFSRDDVRITTRFDPKWINPAMFGTFHETGHAMYEQNVGADLEGTILCSGTSLGIHESQSRLWENLIGRSRGFWKHFFPILQSCFPAQLGSVDQETFYRAINKVEPSFIRVEADEATYNLHIMLRFELEADLMARKIKVSDLPEAWNAKSKEYLGIVPPTDSLGVLQDVHWSMGLLGYFPTYSMGTILSAQLFDKAVAQYPTIPAEIEQGKFDTLLSWLRENIHKHGRKYEPKELVQRATGEALQARSYMKYLKTKYGEIYGITVE
ncbi:MAG: carboxypeptidase M32 [Chloroflexota bacterium]